MRQRISQFMVRNVVEAKQWHPISYVREQMLTNAFSYLPIRYQDLWKLIPDYSIARYLRNTSKTGQKEAACETSALKKNLNHKAKYNSVNFLLCVKTNWGHCIKQNPGVRCASLA